MLWTFKNYPNDEPNEPGPMVESRARAEHLAAFNFGRTVQRLEDAPRTRHLRVLWLLLGVALGATLTAVYLHVFLSEGIRQVAR